MKPTGRLNGPGNLSADLPGATENETTGLPILRTWRGVYLVVLCIFIVWVALLTMLSKMFS